MQISPVSHASAQEGLVLGLLREAKKPFKHEIRDTSLVGLFVIYIPGLFIAALSYAIEPIYEYLWRRSRHQGDKNLGRSTLQLQRAAYQGLRSGAWKGLSNAVPKTEQDVLLTDLTSFCTSECGKTHKTENGSMASSAVIEQGGLGGGSEGVALYEHAYPAGRHSRNNIT
ncbi:hypothetical protein CDD83_6026 [Cordyceps sp. RAO-2017]|nr:hypothetical protein CDD83_6026 [Cordyceps sp. RAO-2017]